MPRSCSFFWCWLRWGDGTGRRGFRCRRRCDRSVLWKFVTGQPCRRRFDGSVGDLDVGDGEGAIIGVVIVAAIALITAVFAVFSIVSMAPVLFAELLVDAALAGGLYRHVRGIDRERHWLTTAIARTGWRFGAVAVGFLAGWLIARAVPGADSIGALLH